MKTAARSARRSDRGSRSSTTPVGKTWISDLNGGGGGGTSFCDIFIKKYLIYYLSAIPEAVKMVHLVHNFSVETRNCGTMVE